jgi:hypothetical protein
VAVQTGADAVPVPYVLASDVVACRPGAGFPLGEITEALVRALGPNAAAVAARVPVLRAAARRTVSTRAAVAAAAIAAAPWATRVHLPVLTLLQTRLLRDLDLAAGTRPPEAPEALAATVAARLGASVGVGLAARTLVRRLPRTRVVDAAVAGVATFGLATAASRLR